MHEQQRIRLAVFDLGGVLVRADRTWVDGARLQGYDPQALSAEAVGEFLGQLVSPVRETETVGVFAALGRVLARDLISPISVPPHDNSAMDGYAFDGAQLASGALRLEVVGTALAGKAWQGQVGPGQCVKIMTGAILPAGLDTVVPQEFTKAGADGRVEIPAGLLQPGVVEGDVRGALKAPHHVPVGLPVADHEQPGHRSSGSGTTGQSFQRRSRS